MAILVDQTTRVLIQGITGREGSRACSEMLKYGTRVLAGVTPGKGGQKIEGIPVYDTVIEAKRNYPAINTSLVAVPAPFVRDAVQESMWADIPFINILTEHVPVADAVIIVAYARARNIRVVGPSSVGVISPARAKIGSIGSSAIETKVFVQGPIGIVSKSGGMTAEIGVTLTRAGLGQSTVVGIGGDQIIGSDFVDVLKLFEKDRDTKAVVIFGEVGGTYEEQAAKFITDGGFRKPVVAIIAGKFSEYLPSETVLGHAGAIVSKGRGSYTSKITALRGAGVSIANTIDEIPRLLKSRL